MSLSRKTGMIIVVAAAVAMTAAAIAVVASMGKSQAALMLSRVQVPLFIGAGVYFSLVGRGIVPISRDAARAAAWRKKWGRFWATIGALLAFYGIIRMMM